MVHKLSSFLVRLSRSVQISQIAFRKIFVEYRCWRAFALAALLLCLKSPDAILHPQFWAEDGFIFFATQLYKAWPMIFASYGGYLHPIPRIFAWCATCFRPENASLIYNSVAIFIDAFCISFVVLRVGQLFSRPAVFVSSFIVPPVGDIFGWVRHVCSRGPRMKGMQRGCGHASARANE
jgi:hypothetical protein